MSNQRGVTLMEMMVVVALMGLLVGISFPSITAGIDSLRLNSASRSIVSFLNGAMNRAERRQEVVEVEISIQEDTLSLRSTAPGFTRTLELPDGVDIQAVLPAIPADPDRPRYFLLFPAGTVPGFGIELANQKGAKRIVSVDPVVGMPKVEVPEG